MAEVREQLPIVAIVGRPNVGKSTLFNRYAGSRRVLVGDTPGVTRDRIAEEIEVEGRRILLVDTAGLEPHASAGLPAAIQAQAESAVELADAILLVVDGKAGLLPEDEAIARALRRSQKPLSLLVNKIDQPGHQNRLNEFYRLGFSRTRAVSAEHATGAFDALEEILAELPPSVAPASERGEGGPVRIALVGRPNVGKSSMANRLAGEERLVVSDVPGTTRDAVDLVIETELGRFVLVDTAGLRRPGRRDRIVERASALMTVRALERADVALLVIDAAEGLTDQDAHIANLIQERGCATAVLANKWDLVPGEDGDRVLDEIRRGLRFLGDGPILPISAKTGARMRRLLPTVETVAAAGARRIPTPILNRWLKEAVRKHEPSMARKGPSRRPIRFLYATQTGVRPPTFLFFCTEPRSIAASYRRYLENQLRESFDLRGTPVRLRLRARSEDGQDKRRRPRGNPRRS